MLHMHKAPNLFRADEHIAKEPTIDDVRRPYFERVHAKHRHPPLCPRSTIGPRKEPRAVHFEDEKKAKAKRNRKRDPLFHVPKVVNKLGRKVDDNKDSLEVVDDFLGHVKREADWHHKNSMHIRAKEEHDGKCWERRKQGHEDIEDAFERKMKALARELQTHQGKISPSDTKLPETYSTYPPPDSCLDPQGVAAAATQAYFAHPLKAESPSRRELQQGTRERMLLYTGAKRDFNRHKKACSTVGAEDWHKQHIHTSDEFFRCRE